MEFFIWWFWKPWCKLLFGHFFSYRFLPLPEASVICQTTYYCPLSVLLPRAYLTSGCVWFKMVVLLSLPIVHMSRRSQHPSHILSPNNLYVLLFITLRFPKVFCLNLQDCDYEETGHSHNMAKGIFADIRKVTNQLTFNLVIHTDLFYFQIFYLPSLYV